MPKKTARATNKPNQQRSKEDQWRKRMAAQARVGATEFTPTNGTGSALAEPEVMDGAVADDERVVSTATAVKAAGAGGTTTRVAPRTQAAAPGRASGSAAIPAAARRSYGAGARNRFGQANVMSIEEEMHFVKRDIRKLIILTAICLAIIIALAFIVPSIIK